LRFLLYPEKRKLRGVWRTRKPRTNRVAGRRLAHTSLAKKRGSAAVRSIEQMIYWEVRCEKDVAVSTGACGQCRPYDRVGVHGYE
jgi:hypothetical protein